MVLKGRARVVGNDVNTDYIISGRYKFKTLDRKELASHLLEDLDPDFVKKIQPGDFIVAGNNFGCGSSREQAPLAIKYADIGAVLARDFARIFFRNAINVGLPLVECDTSGVKDGDELEVDFTAGTVKNLTRGTTENFKPLPRIMLNILAEGGLAPYFQKHHGFEL
ncbi:MAG: 2,3-dimethylmalate dehydratase small subunit [candidate division TA06 bacterium ADurb.Bin417]|uniref:3-isopropylmalate dehydratase small subunit n=1 Tax=candidate division TA06 bacterium ADurb.Bin417 TaxID=1852828 RepID=A0A1V5MHC1_UNCT6|nr:MAG: 2,3-dimethylmalate dehydratase small subunit [candidate division TA06 bacterium ADurb.Bin417]